MEQDVKTVGDLLGILKRRKWSILLPAVAVFAAAAVAAIAWPRTYRSTTTILIEEQEIPREYVAANITTFADQRLQTINQRIMSTPKLLDLVTRFDLYRDLKDRFTTDEIVARMRNDIKFATISADVIDPRTGRPAQATIAFSITYEGRAPESVQQVASELASLYLAENIQTRQKQSSETSKFMEVEMGEVKARLAGIEERIADYKEKNIASLPELAQLNLQAIDQIDRETSRLQDQLRTLKERESYLQQELASVQPTMPEREDEGLKELRARLTELKSRVSDEYPDVGKTKMAIREREEQLRELKTGAPEGKPDNPAYINLSAQLAGTRSEIDSVKRQIDEVRKKGGDYRRRFEAAPRVEEGYRALVAERTGLEAKFGELSRKTMDAKVANGLEKEQLGERFSIIDAARLPERPASPNVPAILLIGLILGLGAGVGTAAVRESCDDTVRSAEQLARATQLPVLVGVPELSTDKDRAVRKRKILMALAGAAAGVVAAVSLFHFFVMDLDVLVARVMRRLIL